LPAGVDKSWFTSQKDIAAFKNSSNYVFAHMPKNMTPKENGKLVKRKSSKIWT